MKYILLKPAATTTKQNKKQQVKKIKGSAPFSRF